MFLVLGIALVCSSIDTLQNAVVAVISRDLADSKLDMEQTRYFAIFAKKSGSFVRQACLGQAFPFDLISAMQDNGLAKKMSFFLEF